MLGAQDTVDTGPDIGPAAGLAAVLAPVAHLAVEVFESCVAAVVDVVDPVVDRLVGPAPIPVLTVSTDDRLVDVHATAFALDEGPAAAARRLGRVVVDELPSGLGARWDLLADDAGLASAVSQPLVDDTGADSPTVVGVLTLYGDHRPGVRAVDRLALTLLASMAATMIAHASAPAGERTPVPLDQLVLDLGVAIPAIDLCIAEPEKAST
jgi:hypothetical protein